MQSTNECKTPERNECHPQNGCVQNSTMLLARNTSSSKKRANAAAPTSVLADSSSHFIVDCVDTDADRREPLCQASSASSLQTSTPQALLATSGIQQERLAYTIVWSPLPPITWLIPFIGHTGICNSNGVASDFRGPYTVGDDGRMAFGAPTRALRIINKGNGGSSISITAQQWDDAIREANVEYGGRMHNICCDNCHSHVAYALNLMSVSAYGVQKWDMVKIAALVFFRADFLSRGAILQQFLPFLLVLTLVLVLVLR